MRNILVLLILLSRLTSGTAQGTINASNFAPGVDSRVFDIDGQPLGSEWLVMLYAGGPGTPMLSLEPIGVPFAFPSGVNSGYFSIGEVAVPFVGPGESALLQVRVWQQPALSWEAAVDTLLPYGCSCPFLSLPLGEPGSGGVDLVGLESFIADQLCCIPEPSTYVLLVLGLGALGVRRLR